MSQGRGNAYAAAMLLIIASLQSCSLWHQASAATHTVGGSKGWDVGVDYTTWAAGQTFKAGDILFFPYSQGEHDVVVVDKAGYDACSEANAVTTYSEGNTNVTISGTGAHYYLCSVVGHCSAGMKLAVTVTATATAPPVAAPTASPPVAAPTTSPPASAPAPSKATPSPASAPAPSKSTPSPAPSPTSTPSSSPAPAPASVETPAPVPSPSSSSAPAPSVASSPSAPGPTPSSAGTPPSSPPPPNAAPSLVSVAFTLLLTPFAVLFAL